MDTQGNVIAMWPRPDTVAARWNAARLRLTLQLVYGRACERRRARMLGTRGEQPPAPDVLGWWASRIPTEFEG
ncbi:hypothetical protein [Nocardia sp. IFM 10818]